MKLNVSILFLSSLLSYQSFAMTCGSLLSSEAVPNLTALEESVKIVESVESDYQALKNFLAKTDEHIKLLELNEKLRAKKGGFARILDAKTVANVNRLKSALRENDLERVTGVANSVMLKFERNILELNFKQEKLAEFKGMFADNAYAPTYTKAEIKTVIRGLEKDIKPLVDFVHEKFKVYTSFRKVFENQISHGISKEARDNAALAYSQTGISDANQEAKIPDYIKLTKDERRPTMAMIMAEYGLVPFPDGIPRHLGGQSLAIKLKLENAALKDIDRRFWLSPRSAHFVIDFFAQQMRKVGDNKVNKFIAKVLDMAVKDLQNLSALNTHLAELNKIDSVSISEQVSSFEKVRSNYMNAGVVRSLSFDFLTSFARAHEYKRLWKHINLKLMLRNVDGTALVDQLITKEKEVGQVSAQLDVVRAELNMKSNNESVPTELSAINTELMNKKKAVESEIAAIRAEIDFKAKEFDSNKDSEVFLMARPGMREDVALLAEMKKADERAVDLGPLSYDYSPGTDARFTRQTIITIAAARFIVVNTPLIKGVDAVLLKYFGFTIPEWSEVWSGSQFLFYKGMEASQTVIEAVSPAL